MGQGWKDCRGGRGHEYTSHVSIRWKATRWRYTPEEGHHPDPVVHRLLVHGCRRTFAREGGNEWEGEWVGDWVGGWKDERGAE